MSRRYTVDVPQLFKLWSDTDYTRAEIARELRLTNQQLRSSSERYGLGPREACRRAFSMEDADSPEEEQASADSLRLSPWVQSRIRELGLGMPK